MVLSLEALALETKGSNEVEEEEGVNDEAEHLHSPNRKS
jgi:hypothetical protein